MSAAAPERFAWRDLLALALVALVLVGSGIGLRDPWPADEPRFASLARDMAASGDWLFPRVGGDLYQDKPPLYFWLLAASNALFGDFRGWFLLPSLLAAFGVLALVYDMGRRLAGREAAMATAIALASTLQFVIAARGAQIDPTLVLITTFSLYALLRHLIFGPAWGWYFAGGLAAGLGVITKGVGFLPILVLLPYALMRRARWAHLAPIDRGGARWALAPLGLLLGIASWFVPMVVAVALRGDPQLLAYRDEILFQQTVGRYGSAWHHVRPWYYFLVEVIPLLWLPWSMLLFWLVPRWRERLRLHDARVWLPLAWVLLVLVFFSLSAGKRGIYILPALPALAFAAAPLIVELLARQGVQRASIALAAVLAGAGLVLAAGVALGHEKALELLRDARLDAIVPLYAFAVGGAAAVVMAARWRPVLAWPAVLACLTIAWGVGVAPRIDSERSARGFMNAVLEAVPRDRTLGLVAYKEQFLLHVDRPVVNFGHRRWREGSQEIFDASSWLAADPERRVLLVPGSLIAPCLSGPRLLRQPAGRASREDWFLVSGYPSGDCVRRGDPARAIRYRPS